MAAMDTLETPRPKHEKKSKKEKSPKKRALEEEAIADPERRHKKSKSEASHEAATDNDRTTADGDHEEKKSKKNKHKSGDAVEDADKVAKKEKKKKKQRDAEAGLQSQEGDAVPIADVDEPSTKKKSKNFKTEAVLEEGADEKKDKKKKKKSKHHHETDATDDGEAPESSAVVAETTATRADAMDIDVDTTKSTPKSSRGKIHQPSDIPANPQFPFFYQTVSVYEPIYPNGWAKPITGCESQHLLHLQNRYVPSLRGVLLDYSKVTLGQTAGRAGAAADDESPTILTSRGEFGGAFGWITADVRLFVPSRGAWMEGSVNLQTEGHIGVVCFGKFNASIEARRLPTSWRWVPSEQAEGGFDDGASIITAADEHGVVRQIHSTGYWVDADGEKVSGKVRFRIRNFDVGVSGDSTYLSLQGTMLDGKSERKLVETEAREAKERKERKGGKWRERRSVPDFSMTRFATEENEQQQDDQATQSQLQKFTAEAEAAKVGEE